MSWLTRLLAPTPKESGLSRLNGWFGKDRESFCVLPRALMNEMPDEWQQQMAGLLEEMDAEFPAAPHVDYLVRAKGEGGRFCKIPKVLTDYWNLNQLDISRMRHW